MASPFRIFRKYQKTLLVAAGVVLMFVFVIGDALVGYLGRSRRGGGDAQRDAGAIAVRWNGDSLTNSELNNLVVRRRILNAFIQGVEFAGRQAAFEAGVEPRSLRVEPMVGAETPQQGVERSVVQTRLFAQAAREAGMRVGDETIVQYLDELGRGNVSREQMRAMLSRLQSGNWRVSIDFVIDALREEMLARNYIASHQFAFDTVTPQQRWDDWLQVNDRVSIEAAAIPAERFLTDVPEPAEAELVAFFDENKNREPQPDVFGQMEFPSPTPGFKVPRKIGVQFIKAGYDEYVSKVEGEITDEEIQKYYDENKDPLFIKADTGLIEGPSEGEAARESTEETKPSASDAPNETPPTSPDADKGSTTPAENPPAASAPEQTEPATPPATEPAPPEGDQSSRSTPLRGPFRLAAFLQEGDAEKPAEAPSKSAEDAAQGDEKAASAPPEAASPPPEGSDAKPSDASTPATQPAADKPKEFQPLDEVRDVIRGELAKRRASEKLGELINELASQLNAEFNSYFSQVLDAQAEERDPPPPPPALANLEPLATKHGLEHGKTGPASWLELRETGVGKSGNSEMNGALWQHLFLTRDLELYQPITTVDIDGNRYLVMKTSDTPERVPEFAEVKDEVLGAWKQQRAAELALKHAEEQAKKAKEAGSTLADYFAPEQAAEVVRTDLFSHYTGGDVALVGGEFQQQPFRLSEPDGITAAGPEFLQRVFELKEGEVAAVLNHDHSMAYVIRLIEHEHSPEELRSTYLAEANTWPGLRMMIGSHARVAAASLVNDIVKDAGLEWQRPYDQIEPEEEEAG
jgi:hypothetical protein